MTTIDAMWEHNYRDDCAPNFAINMERPRHRWYDFKEGFSSTLVDRAILETKKTTNSTDFTVLDPFSGSGTTPLTALQNGCNAIGFEVNPFMSFVGKTKCSKIQKSAESYRHDLRWILRQVPTSIESKLEGFSTFTPAPTLKKWLFNTEVIRTFEALYFHISKVDNNDFFLLALISAIMQCCNARKDGKCLRYIKGWQSLNFNAASLRDCFERKSLEMINDIETDPLLYGDRDIQQGDTRLLLKNMENNSVDLVVFSPPYLNSFDYSDIYRPELFLGGFVDNNDSLRAIRKQTLRSHVQYKWEANDTSDSVWVNNIVDKLDQKKEVLWSNDIPQMVSLYFYDMDTVLKETYRVSKCGAQLWFVVSTSAYAGIEIPVDLILADIANKHGWELESVNALRKLRTSSQCVDENIRRVRLRESLVICRK